MGLAQVSGTGAPPLRGVVESANPLAGQAKALAGLPRFGKWL